MTAVSWDIEAWKASELGQQAIQRDIETLKEAGILDGTYESGGLVDLVSQLYRQSPDAVVRKLNELLPVYRTVEDRIWADERSVEWAESHHLETPPDDWPFDRRAWDRWRDGFVIAGDYPDPDIGTAEQLRDAVLKVTAA